MKKLILMTTAILTLNTTVAVAGTCELGTVIKGQNGHEYCVSAPAMTWWSAIVWCEKQGRKLATFNQACVDTDSVCENLKGTISKTVWTVTPKAAASYFVIDLSSGFVTNSDALSGGRVALCY